MKDVNKDMSEYFEQAWYVPREHDKPGRAEAWDRRAGDWDAKYRREEERQLHEVRIKDTAEFLRARGLLGADRDVADIGCGPGRFAAEFAATARSVLGVDVSENMAHYGRQYCAERGFENTSFAAVDFPKADIAALGWEGKFDLVFSSITPAVSGRGIDNLIAMSRAWCCNICFVENTNFLQDDVMRQVFGREPKKEKTSHSYWFFTLFGLLWHRGYFPETDYYSQHREIRLAADRATAERYTRYLLDDEGAGEENIIKTERYLRSRADADGMVNEISDCRFGRILWDVRDRRK